MSKPRALPELIEVLREIDMSWHAGYVFVRRDGSTLALREIIAVLEDKRDG